MTISPSRPARCCFRLDPAPIDTATDQAAAELAAARQALKGASASYEQRGVELSAARTTLAYQLKELARQKGDGGLRRLLSSPTGRPGAKRGGSRKAQVAGAEKAQANALGAPGDPGRRPRGG